MSSARLLAAMAAHLPRLPFLLLFVFLAVHVPASHGQPPKLPATYDPSMCSNSAKCGGVDITYPFYLSTGIREIADYSGNNYSCGYSDLEISCQDVGETKIPIIQLDQDKYIIQHIFYDTTTIILADSDVLGGPPDPCPRVRHNVTFDVMWLHYNASSYDNLTFFFDCDPMLTGGFDMGKNYTINCTGSSSSSGGGVSFVFTAEDLEIAQEHELAARCSENVIVPVQRDALMKNDPNMLARGHYIEVLQAGFELEWNRPTTTEAYQCYGCEGSGGRCAYGQSKVFLGCLCSEGKVGNPNCKNSGDTSKAHASCLVPKFHS